jgi:hypothetical protein
MLCLLIYQNKKKVFIKKLLAVCDIFVDTFAKEPLRSFNGKKGQKKKGRIDILVDIFDKFDGKNSSFYI